jgi:hypothetical protein
MSLSIDTIDAAITTLLGKLNWDYKNGNFSMKRSEQMEQLIALRKQVLENPDLELETIAFDFDITAMGRNDTQVEL